MLIILNPNPKKAVAELISKTDKRFCWKQLLELSQLLSSCSITNKMKPVKQGKELKQWILKNPCWTFTYFHELYLWCLTNVNLSLETRDKLYSIQEDLLNYAYNFKLKYGNIPVSKAIFRYKKGYECLYKTNTELSITEAVKQYNKYITEYKFKERELK